MSVVGSVTVLKKEYTGDLITLDVKITGGRVALYNNLIIYKAVGHTACRVRDLKVNGESKIDVRCPEGSETLIYIDKFDDEKIEKGDRIRVEEAQSTVGQFRVAKSPAQ